MNSFPSDHALSRAPVIEMIANPDFHMPRDGFPSDNPDGTASDDQQSRSLQIPLGMAAGARSTHRRAVSTLPSFTFNAANTSGLQHDADAPDSLSPDPPAHTTPTRRGHRRGASEFVGGDSRFGLQNTISTSPGKTAALSIPAFSALPPPGRRGHAHRRSAAMSSHDVTNIMQAPEASPRLSSSLPGSPLDQSVPPPINMTSAEPLTPSSFSIADPFGPSESPTTDGAARPRVGFSDNVEYIPRPLSTISSETEESMSIHRGHSVNTSISSMLSLGTPSPVARNIRQTLSTTFEDENRSTVSQATKEEARHAREGAWLTMSSSENLGGRPISEPCLNPSSLSFDSPDSPTKPRTKDPSRKKQGRSLGFSRRKSEPSIHSNACDVSHLSTISLPGVPVVAPETDDLIADIDFRERPSSRRKIKSWALARFNRGGREARKASSMEMSSEIPVRPHTASVIPVFARSTSPEPVMAETDLDAVFSSQNDDSLDVITSSNRSRPEIVTPASSYQSSFHSTSPDDNPVLDLDAALGPFKTPPLGSHRARRELHSSRSGKEFYGSTSPYHRRTESAPVLPLFDASARSSAQPAMDDVFEEEEEDDSPHAVKRHTYGAGSTVGINVVDSSAQSSDAPFQTASTGLGIYQQNILPRPAPEKTPIQRVIEDQHDLVSSPTQEPLAIQRSNSTRVEIADDHDVPRTSSLTKTSDSSDASTILVAPNDSSIGASEMPPVITTSGANSTSAVSSPDLTRRQGSFDTSRIGTSASSIADNRTISSFGQDYRASVDDVPSLTSSRSTMLSTRREFGADVASAQDPPANEDNEITERRKKRASIQSLSQLVGGSFGSKSKTFESSRPQTAVDISAKGSRKRKHRLEKLLFWKSKTDLSSYHREEV